MKSLRKPLKLQRSTIIGKTRYGSLQVPKKVHFTFPLSLSPTHTDGFQRRSSCFRYLHKYTYLLLLQQSQLKLHREFNLCMNLRSRPGYTCVCVYACAEERLFSLQRAQTKNSIQPPNVHTHTHSLLFFIF